MPDVNVHEKLRERLDMFPQGFPKTKSGVELEILQNLFSTEEAEIALALRPYPEPVSTIADRISADAKEETQMVAAGQDQQEINLNNDKCRISRNPTVIYCQGKSY